jgi:eukaryotic-like serine/threonine-protein kinase
LQQASYQLLELVARGGMGAVYRARYRDRADFEREVAVKVLRSDVGEHEELGRRLRDEARLLGLLRHPAIVRVDRLALLDGRWALVMEYVDGLDLRQLASVLRVPAGVALEVVEVVADALASAGQARDTAGRLLGLQHRDLKPSNIMLTAHGEVKLLDFGVAQACFDGRESSTQALQLGTVDYMAPERLAGGEGSPAADVYSLGVVLWEVLAGERFGQTSPQLLEHRAHVQRAQRILAQRRPELEVGLVALLGDLLSWSPVERPSAAALVERAAREVRAAAAPPLRSWCRSELRGRRRPPAGDDPLVGSVLTPGAVAVPVALGAWPDEHEISWDDRTAVGTSSIPVTTGPSPRDGAIVPPDDEPVADRQQVPVPLARSVEHVPPSSVVPKLILLGASVLALMVGAVVMVLVSRDAPEAPVQHVVGAPAVVEPVSVPTPPPEPPPARVQAVRPAPVRPNPAPIELPSSAVPEPIEPAPVAGVAPAPQGSVWGEGGSSGRLSTAGLEVTDPAAVWRAEPSPSQAQLVWADGVRVELSGDASEVVLVDEQRGFPVPGVVPAGSWFVRVRFGDGDPVVAGVIELEGPGPRTLRCDAHMSWCSIQP